METLFDMLRDTARDAARGGITIGRKVIRIGHTTVKIIVKIVFDRSK